ncbi:unnamed protein product [Kluyveromyces dobzhanskii CBS 2104]|uniref:WGS project CCBQ000000000 data, contig 00107 n=1 Tax=Kluyveromyces dobzhanskii CBS 2104 TaxID=1427455 RepID=A0A0A8L158_9SACH|nr:unnamed protein product [Kluyveromyces dobzhanskii CBS 2104]
MANPSHHPHLKHKHSTENYPSPNKEFMESQDFVGLDNPPEPQKTPHLFANKSDSKQGNYVNDLLSSVSQKLKNPQQPFSTREHRHLFQQKAFSPAEEEAPDSGDKIKFKSSYADTDSTDDDSHAGKNGNGESLIPPPPPPDRRRSSLYEDFKKAYYQDTHMFDQHK